MKKPKILIAILLLILAVTAAIFLIPEKTVAPDQELSDTPPTLDLSFLQGNLLTGSAGDADQSCPGILKENAATNTTAEAINLTRGINLVHSQNNLSIPQILSSLEGKAGNKVLIVYYNPKNNPNSLFSIYPPANQPTEINNLSLGSSIPANTGFFVLTCQDIQAYGLKSETQQGSELPTALRLNQVENQWILIPKGYINNEIKLPTIGTNKYTYWAQTGSIKIETPAPFPSANNTDILNNRFSNFKMVWIKVEKLLTPEETEEVSTSCFSENCTSEQENNNNQNDTVEISYQHVANTELIDSKFPLKQSYRIYRLKTNPINAKTNLGNIKITFSNINETDAKPSSFGIVHSTETIQVSPAIPASANQEAVAATTRTKYNLDWKTNNSTTEINLKADTDLIAINSTGAQVKITAANDNNKIYFEGVIKPSNLTNYDQYVFNNNNFCNQFIVKTEKSDLIVRDSKRLSNLTKIDFTNAYLTRVINKLNFNSDQINWDSKQEDINKHLKWQIVHAWTEAPNLGTNGLIPNYKSKQNFEIGSILSAGRPNTTLLNFIDIFNYGNTNQNHTLPNRTTEDRTDTGSRMFYYPITAPSTIQVKLVKTSNLLETENSQIINKENFNQITPGILCNWNLNYNPS